MSDVSSASASPLPPDHSALATVVSTSSGLSSSYGHSGQESGGGSRGVFGRASGRGYGHDSGLGRDSSREGRWQGGGGHGRDRAPRHRAHCNADNNTV